MSAGLHVRALVIAVSLSAFAGCTEPTPPPTALEIFRCHKLLIGTAPASCTEDVVGPGTLAIELVPDPPHGSWTVAVSGLQALAEACEFHGSFDRTRLAALEGRGATSLRCPVAATVDRAYHELAFTQKDPAPGSSLAVTVRMTR